MDVLSSSSLNCYFYSFKMVLVDIYTKQNS